jgi:hypothetical protein
MDGTTVVVTGASRGIGAAVAELLAGEGALVVGCARDEAALDALTDRVEGPGRVVPVRADVRDEFDVEHLVETAAREGGGIDAVVACAAVAGGTPGEMPVADQSYTTFDSTMDTNVRGVFATLREALPHMDTDGRAVVPSGGVAREATAGMGAYAVSKAAAEALARQFAVDADPAVGVVDPGLVATRLTGGGGRDPADVAPMFRWALVEAPAEDLDGGILGLREWRQATR